MGNGYNHHLHHQSFYSKNSFLPILCRLSIKDVKLKAFKDPSSSFSDDPSSPKVGCMGQVKKNTKLLDFPATYRLTSATSSSAITTTRSNSTHINYPKYTKLKRFFSGRNLMPSSTTTTNGAVKGGGGASSCRSSRGICRNGSRRLSKINHDDGYGNNQVGVKVNINELDPPLPVVKKVAPPPEVSLWKRRSGGMALKGLQIEQIHQLPNNNYSPAPTV